MPWFRDAYSPLGARLRTLVVLGLVVALFTEVPLGVIGGMSTVLTLGGTGPLVGSVSPRPDGPSEPELAAAAKRKRNAQDTDTARKHTRSKSDTPGKDESDKQDKPGKGHAGKKDKDHAGKKGSHRGAGKGKHTSKGNKPGKNDGAQHRKRKDKSATTGRIAAADVTTAAVAPLTVTPVADSQVNEATPSTNYGTVTRLTVDGGSDPVVASYLRFTVSGVDAPVQRATLRLWVRAESGTQNGPEVRTTGTSWSETGLTWTNRPAPSGGVLDDKGKLTGSTWAEYDVTNAVSGNGAVSFVLLLQTNDGVIFDSREGGHGPELVITIEDDPPPEPSPTASSEPDPTATPDVTATPEPTPTSPPPSGVGIFSDDFESGDLSQWTVSSGLVVQQQEVASGDWAARGASTGSRTYARQPLSAPQSELFYRIRFKIISQDPANSVSLLKLRTENDVSLLTLSVTGAGQLGVRNDVVLVGRTSSQTVTPGVWHEAQVHLRVDVANPTAGQVEVWYDGELVRELSRSENFGAALVGWLQLGEHSLGKSYDVVFDDVVTDTRFIATLPPVIPPPLPTATPIPEPTTTATPEPTATPESIPTPTATPPTGGSATLLAAGDIAGCATSGDEATAKLLDGLAGTVVTLGDNVYDSGTASEFTNCYNPTWGRHKSRTKPAPGNHDYLTSGASGYFGYFGAAAGASTKGYYSYDLGSWHIVALNSNCSQAGGCGVGSPQETWLKNDLAAHPTTCTLAYWHHPHFSFGNYSTDTRMQALWQALEAAGAEIVLSGHDHNYQRWAPQTWNGTKDTARGIREFVVGTGGKNHYPLKTPPANVEKANDDTFGILQLTLRATSYDWTFVPEAGKTFTDSGSTACH